jgi:hypothetical protein
VQSNIFILTRRKHFSKMAHGFVIIISDYFGV